MRSHQWEAQSTEEVLHKIEAANKKLEDLKVKELVIGSLDVEALYPSIDQQEGPKIVAQEIVKSKLRFEISICNFFVHFFTKVTCNQISRVYISLQPGTFL